MNGLLLVDKAGMSPLPRGACVAPDDGDSRRTSPPTSHDIVQRVRRLSRQKRIGHTGTLDPMASGLVVLCLGWATRLVEYYQGHDKRYRAEIALGCETDTLDALGKIVDTAPVPSLTRANVEAVLAGFVGDIAQIPPLFSALKQEGESIHYKVRRGEHVEVDARLMTIHALELIDFNAPDRLILDVHCSAGTYVRSLARDVGIALGTHGTLVGLRRAQAGAFTVQDAHTMAALEEAAAQDALSSLLLAPGTGLDLPAVTVDAGTAVRLGHGQAVTLPEATTPLVPDPTSMNVRIQARSENGALLGILAPVTPEEARWKADKWFGGLESEAA